MKHKIFCYVCKKHISIEAENKKEAIQKFDSCGHDREKVRELKKDIILSY